MSIFREMNIEKLKNNTVVEEVTRNTIHFTFAFKVKMFEKWKTKPVPECLKEVLEKVGILEEDLSQYTIKDLARGFYLGGYPFQKQYLPEIDPEFTETNPLVISGFFFRTNTGRGLSIVPEFREHLKKMYPTISVEEGMRCVGLDPLDVGCTRIRKLSNEFASELAAEHFLSESGHKVMRNEYIDSVSLIEHPYVKFVNRGNVYLTDAFYNEACIMPVSLSKVFEIYGIEEEQVNEESRMRINSAMKMWEPTKTTDFAADESILVIQRRRALEMHKAMKEGLYGIGKVFGQMKRDDQRRVCRWISQLPRDPWGYYSCKKILEIMKISKSRFYALLNDENYGMGSIRKAAQDVEDIAAIRSVIDYKNFEKGIRQIYMLMPRVTGQYFSMYRIRRLMNKYGIRTNIRHPSRNRKAMKELIERNRKANLIMRRFRLHRPNEVRLTDVTYLDYGDDKRAYGSASVDPVTGRLICFIVSENNDLQLALDTLEAMDTHPAKSGAILHSDQGIVYMVDDFQAAVVEKELNQSMSRRGNCWDNAVQESFFGHFKDECHYEECKNLEELQECIDRYSFYYNNERGMWDRGRMTPAEYEKYLEGMSEAEFSEYLAREEKRFADMKAKSAENAHMAAKNYKEFTEKSIGGLSDEICGSFEEI